MGLKPLKVALLMKELSEMSGTGRDVEEIASLVKTT
jgi:hypothetical protein